MWQSCNVAISLAVLAAIVYGLAKLLRSKPIIPDIPKPRRSSIIAICVLAIMLLAAVSFVVVWSRITGNPIRQHGAARQFGYSHLWIAN